MHGVVSQVAHAQQRLLTTEASLTRVEAQQLASAELATEAAATTAAAEGKAHQLASAELEERLCSVRSELLEAQTLARSRHRQQVSKYAHRKM